MVDIVVAVIEAVYSFLWDDLITVPLPGGGTIGFSLLVILLIPAGIFFTIRTRFLPVRLFPDMIRATVEKRGGRKGLSSLQALMVSTATRVGMGNLVGVVAAISVGGAGAVFWMWAHQLCWALPRRLSKRRWLSCHKEKDPLYGGYRRRSGLSYSSPCRIQAKAETARRRKGADTRSSPFCLPISGLICWCGISQVYRQLGVFRLSITPSIFRRCYTTVVLVARGGVYRAAQTRYGQSIWISWFLSWRSVIL